MSLHPQVQTLLEGIAQAGGPPTHELTPDEARAGYEVMAALDVVEEVTRVDDRVVPAPEHDVPVRVYTPADAVGATPGVLLWIHGGGWVIGDLDTADATARALANRSGAVVVSVDYRRAPEHRAPAALEDCLAALAWTVENAELLGSDSSRVAVGGDSAGGNLAALLCQRVRDDFGPQIDFQLLVCPVTDLALSGASMEEFAEGYLLTKAAMEWFVGHYAPGVDPTGPQLSPLHAASLAGLPPALVVTAEFDPLRDQGEAYARRLLEAGVKVDVKRYDGQIHGFYGLRSLVDDAVVALDDMGGALRAVLA